ncbi:MAG: nuclear transport factor 2 family protein [Bacteroidota bacterium]
MKKIILSIVALAVIVCSCSSQEQIDVAQEEEAIKNVIKQEIDLWRTQDIKEAEFYKKADYLRLIYNNGNSHQETVGWDSLYASVKRITEADWSEASDIKFECKDFHIKVYDDVAWAVYEVPLSWIWKGEPGESSSTKVTFLEKVDGYWKIVLNSQTTMNPCQEDEDEEDETEE